MIGPVALSAIVAAAGWAAPTWLVLAAAVSGRIGADFSPRATQCGVMAQ
ncbi:hypothetical protein IC615_15720 [Serratia ureilytica]